MAQIETNNDPQNNRQKTKYWAPRKPLKPTINSGTPEGLSILRQHNVPRVKKLIYIWS
jgi:hypothetical protein